jgi:hypothetical protein
MKNKQNYIDWDNEKELGMVSDTALSKKYGVSDTAVRGARLRRGIPALNPQKTYDIDWDCQPLGKMTDQHLADILGCSGGVVAKQRNKRNIKPYGILHRTIEGEASYYEETIIDHWLHNNNVQHKFQYKIGSYRVDWLIGEKDVWEFLGMWDHKLYGKTYQENFLKKKTFLESLGYSVRSIHRSDMNFFRTGVDLKKIESVEEFICKGCNRKMKHQAKGFCSRCYTYVFRGKKIREEISVKLKKDEVFVCSSCGSSKKHKRVRDLCSACYSRQHRSKA